MQHIWYGAGSYTGTSDASTFQFPPQDRRCYLLLGANVPFSLLVMGATTAEAKDPITGAALSVTANGNYNFTVGGFSWYITPRALAII